MTERLNINTVTMKSEEWTSKVQVIDKGRPRDNLQKTTKYQLMILQDEEETQVQEIMYGGDITHYAKQFVPFHTYLVSVATIKESNYAYGIPINNFLWTIDKGTLVEPIEEVDPPEVSLPPPTRLTLTMFNNFDHQPEGLEFDILAVVVNVGFPTCAANGSRIQDLIIIDDQKKPTKFTLWENFIDHDGIKIVEHLDEYPIILCRKVGKSKSFPGLTTRFGTTIQINPPYPQVAALRTWVRSNEELLIAYTKKSTTSAGSLQIIPFEDQIRSYQLPMHINIFQCLPDFIQREDFTAQLVAARQILFQDANVRSLLQTTVDLQQHSSQVNLPKQCCISLQKKFTTSVLLRNKCCLW